MSSELAQAILKLAEVHDRRLGDIGAALGRLADQLTYNEGIDAKPTAASQVVRAMDCVANALESVADELPVGASPNDGEN